MAEREVGLVGVAGCVPRRRSSAPVVGKVGPA